MKHNYVPPLIPFIVLGLLWKFVTSAKLWTAYILPPPERPFSADSRGSSKKKRNDCADRRRQHTDADARGEPRQRARQHITPHPVRPKQILKARRQVFARKIRDHRLLLQTDSSHRNNC